MLSTQPPNQAAFFWSNIMIQTLLSSDKQEIVIGFDPHFA